MERYLPEMIYHMFVGQMGWDTAAAYYDSNLAAAAYYDSNLDSL